jgi:hypothetical protein
MDMVQTLLRCLSNATRADVQDPTPVQSNGNGHGNGGNGGNGVHHRRRRPQLRDGARQAACRAYAGARFVLDHGVSIVDASHWTGSNPNYVAAMLEVIASDNVSWLQAVLRGHVPVLLAGERAKKFNRLVEAYEKATPATKAAFCKLVGQEKLFDELIAPATEAVTYETFLETPNEVVTVEELRS